MPQTHKITPQEALQRTIELLSASTLDYLATLEATRCAHGCRFVHGFPPDEVKTYLFQIGPRRLHQTLAAMPEPLCFVGHTHELELVCLQEGAVERRPLPTEPVELAPAARCIDNVGSVGQPRDGDNRAKYVLWDSTARTLEVCRVGYDIAAVVDKILRAGLPRVYADRLW